MKVEGYDLGTLRRQIEEFIELEYPDALDRILSKRKQHLLIDFKKIVEFEYQLAEFLLDNPIEGIYYFNEHLLEQIKTRDPNYEFFKIFTVRFKNLPKTARVELKKIRANDLIKFIAIEGVVKLKSSLINLITNIIYECPSCGNLIDLEQDISENIREPKGCVCGRRGSFKRISEKLIDFYFIDLEEPLDIIDDSNKPTSIRAWFKQGLSTEKVFRNLLPGSKVRLNGHFAERIKKNTKGAMTAMMDRFFEVSSVEFLQETFDDLKYTEEDVKKFEEIAKRPDWLDYLRKEIFKEIKGHDDECKSVILQMIGGVKQRDPLGKDVKGTINIFFLGDPGTSKSSILKIAQKFALKAKYVAGAAVSGAGLIGTVSKNEFTGAWEVQAGAFSLSNKGMLMIDELDKISTDYKQAMHEPLSEECYHPDTVIVFSDGSQVKLGDFVRSSLEKDGVGLDDLEVNQDFKIDFVKKIPSYSFSQAEMINANTNFLFTSRCTDDLYEIEFSNGYSMKVTPTHPVYYYSPLGEVEVVNAQKAVPGLVVPHADELVLEPCEDYSLKELTKIFNDFKGDLGDVKGYPLFFNNDLAELLGCFVRSGSISDESVNFIIHSEEMYKRISWILNKNFNVIPEVSETKVGDSSRFLLKVNNSFFKYWFTENFGCLTYQSNSCLPKAILTDKELARYFLSGFINRKKEFVKTIHSNKELLQKVQLVFLVFGIKSIIRFDNESSKFVIELVKNEDFKVEVVSVKKVKKDTEWVYDVNIPMTHNFVSTGGLLLHNTISFSKAGVDQVLPAEVAVLAAANPKHGTFSKYDSIYAQVDMSDTLFNRFDLVHIFKEVGDDEKWHLELAEKIMDTANKDYRIDPERILFLKKYIAHAKTFKPKLPKEVIKELSQIYARLKVQLVRAEPEAGKPIPINARNMDSLRRLSQAVARSRFHEEVTLEDGLIAFDFLKNSLVQLGLDPHLGQDKVQLEDPITGEVKTLETKDLFGIVKSEILHYVKIDKRGLPLQELLNIMKKRGIKEDQVLNVLVVLRRRGDVYEPTPGFLRMI